MLHPKSFFIFSFVKNPFSTLSVFFRDRLCMCSISFLKTAYQKADATKRVYNPCVWGKTVIYGYFSKWGMLENTSKGLNFEHFRASHILRNAHIYIYMCIYTYIYVISYILKHSLSKHGLKRIEFENKPALSPFALIRMFKRLFRCSPPAIHCL